MTFGLLRTRTLGDELKTAEFLKDYVLLGYFYDHKTEKLGFVFEEESLEMASCKAKSRSCNFRA